MTRIGLSFLGFMATLALSPPARAVRSAELYSAASYGYGRVEAHVRFAAGDGVVSSFFAWKEGSEVAGAFWNELDFEKVGADCHVETNPLYGNPPVVHSQKHTLGDLCGAFHTYAYEWTPEAIVWIVDGVEIRRDTGAAASAFADNAGAGMRIHFNVWPGDATFGGNFSPTILPVHQYIDWVQFSSYAGGTFTLEWREDFEGDNVPAGWLTGNWASPKNLSTHDVGNVNFLEGYAVLSLTADDAVGPAGAMPEATGGTGSTGAGGDGTGGAGASGGAAAGGTSAVGNGGTASGTGGTAGTGGASAAGSAGSSSGAGATNDSGFGGQDPTSRSGSGESCSFAAHGKAQGVAWLGGLGLAAIIALRRSRQRPSNG